VKPIADVPIFLSITLSRASIDSKRILHTMFNHSGGMICHDVFRLYGRLGRAAEREWTEMNATD